MIQLLGLTTEVVFTDRGRWGTRASTQWGRTQGGLTQIISILQMRQLRCGEADTPRASQLAQTQVCRLQSPCSSSEALGSAFWITGCHLKAWTWTQTLPFWVTVAQGPAVVTKLITKCPQGVKGPRSGREHAPPLVLSLLFWKTGDAPEVRLCQSRGRRPGQSYLRSLAASTGCWAPTHSRCLTELSQRPRFGAQALLHSRVKSPVAGQDTGCSQSVQSATCWPTAAGSFKNLIQSIVELPGSELQPFLKWDVICS